MFETNWWQRLVRSLLTSLMAVILVVGLGGCGGAKATMPPDFKSGSEQPRNYIAEASPPPVIQALRQELEQYQPQVTILSPKPNEVLQDTTVTVKFRVQDLPLFKNADLGLGPHLHVFLDNQPYRAVYDSSQPLVFEDVTPGTHTLRVFASRPWHESFKNEGAYAQTTFHIFTKTDDNNLNLEQPLLTYSRPQGSYGAEPIMLDFYLTNAPKHQGEGENADINDWRIRSTINGESFMLDQWQPIYLKGFKSGKNWVQLELIDDQGNRIPNAFNNTVRVITYEPNGKDTLAQLTRGELSIDDARGIVDPNYVAKKPVPEPVPAPVEEPSEVPIVEETPAAEQPEVETPEVETPEVEATQPTQTPISEPQPTETPSSDESVESLQASEDKEEIPSPNLSPTAPEVTETPAPETVAPKVQAEAAPEPEPIVTPPAIAEPNPSAASVPTETKQIEQPKPGGFFNRFRVPSADKVKSSAALAPEAQESSVSIESSLAPEAARLQLSLKQLKEIFLAKPAPTNSPLPIIQVVPSQPKVSTPVVESLVPHTTTSEIPQATETSETSTDIDEGA